MFSNVAFSKGVGAADIAMGKYICMYIRTYIMYSTFLLALDHK